MSVKPSSNILICGMHRSGTSLTGKFFQNIGYHFGMNEDLLEPKEFNKEGFWERADVIKLNNRMLTLLGMSWDYPLVIPAKYMKEIAAKNILQLADEARKIIEKLDAPFAIKDPRFSLLLPFWKEIVPDAKIIIVVRNPLEVTRSLRKRNRFSIHLGLMLWKKYYQAIMTHTQPAQRFFLFQDKLLSGDQGLIEAILDYLELDDTDNIRSAINLSVNKSLLSFSDEPPPETVLTAPYHKEINQLWQLMRDEAGYISKQAVAKPDKSDVLTNT